MTLSNSLRNRKEQHGEKNTSSKHQEKDMTKAVKSTIEYLENKYPTYEFGWNKQLKLKDIYKWTINNLSNCLEDDNYINWIRLNKEGDKIKRINRMTLKEGKRKFVGKAA